ncbi:hypothetical protein OAJ57_02730 [Alphaproteobacteria bacterium]|nr:hypothetical protein [Alphaproteobacteria bacterium]
MGAEHATSMRNSTWEYKSFKPDGKRNAKAKVKCYSGSHMHHNGDKCVFSMKTLKTAAM